MFVQDDKAAAPELVYQRAARLFRLLATANRLKIVHALCEGELNVTQLLARIDSTQSNMSQQLNILYRVGILARRRDGVKIYYRIDDQVVANLCRAVCIEVHGKLMDSGLKEAA